MRRLTPPDLRLTQAMADIYTRSVDAAAVAAMARHLGLGELRLAGTTPYLSYVVDAPPGPSRDALLDALTAYATVAFGAPTTIIALASVPQPRRAAVWASAPVVTPTAETGQSAAG